jgi:hypothetical protein
LWAHANQSYYAFVEYRVRQRLNAGEKVYYFAAPEYALHSHPRFKEYGDAPIYVKVYIATKSVTWDFAVPNER